MIPGPGKNILPPEALFDIMCYMVTPNAIYTHNWVTISSWRFFWHTQFVLYCGLLPQLKEIFGYEEISFETIKWLQFVITIKKIYARFGIFIVYTIVIAMTGCCCITNIKETHTFWQDCYRDLFLQLELFSPAWAD